ncbi:MAG: HAD-IC family P-type ATPase, partial [Campylobacterales bacterium]|nr:HAD-IC family P-type ATPase [Campylobacterales bacterium]
MQTQNAQWHRAETREVLEGLESATGGLSAEEAVRRLERYGPNELEEKKRKSPLGMFLDQFRDFMILVLIAAAVIAGFIGDPSDAIAIVIIVVLNAVIGFVQEYRAQKAMEALRKMAGATATVLRDGTPTTVSAADIVPGDIVTLEAGNIVPADLRLTEAVNLKVSEASLTGESVPVEKQTESLVEEGLGLSDRKNMSYRGTHVTFGRATGIATATGMETELGKIALMLQDAGEMKTPLQKRLAAFGQKLAIAVLVICAVIFMVGIVRGEEPLMMLLTAISLAVAAIPEALPAVVTISLALGAKKLVRQNALIRKLPAVETLGSVTYICSDKTGTLTLNRMSAEEVYVDGVLQKSATISDADPGKLHGENSAVGEYFMAALALCNDTQADAEGNLIGDPTETALYDMAKTNGFERQILQSAFPRVAEIPFDSERKCMTTFHEFPGAGGKYVSFTKGALDVLILKSANILTSQGLQTIDAEELERINEAMAADGMRILCLCMRLWDDLPVPV